MESMQQAIDALLVSVPLPEPALVYTYECELKSDFSLAPEQLARSKPALQRYKDHVLHGTLLDNNQILEIRPLQITASEDELPCIRIRYSIPIISTVVFTTTAAAGLLCWVLSQNGLLVRHSLENAFSNRPLEQWTRTTPVESIADKHFVCMSVTSSGVATIGCEDGTVVHVQDLEQQKAPASSIHFHIVRQGKGMVILFTRFCGMSKWDLSRRPFLRISVTPFDDICSIVDAPACRKLRRMET